MDTNQWKQDGRIISAVNVTPHNVNDNIYDALYIGTGGNVSISVGNDGGSVLFRNVISGTVLPVNTKKVMFTDTTAQHILGLTIGYKYYKE